MSDRREQQLEVLLAGVDDKSPAEAQEFVRHVPDTELGALETKAQELLSRLPVPIGRQVDDPAARRRRALERVVASVQARRGDASALLECARRDWLGGASHATYLRTLLEHGREAEAVAMARTLLRHGTGHDKEALETLLEEAARPPDGWTEAVRRFAESPSLEAWEELVRFIPAEVYDQRVRYTLTLLRRLEVPAEIVFRCATHQGATSDAIELIEEGLVEWTVVEERAQRTSSTGRPLWLGLAARAACMHGDAFNTVRLLREALTRARSAELLERDISFVRARADGELHVLLDRAGIPRR